MASHFNVAAVKVLTDAIQAVVDTLPTTMVGTNNAALASTLEDAMQKATAPAYNQDTDSLEALRELLDTIAGYIDTEIAAITPAGATKAEMDTGHGLLATPAQVATAISTYDPPTRTEATADKDAVIAAIPAMVGTNSAMLAVNGALEATLTAIKGGGWSTQTLVALMTAIAAIPTTAMRGTDSAATEAKQDIIDTNVDDIETLVATTVAGRLQVATTTWDLLRGGAGAGTDVLFTGATQAVILESLIVRMPTLANVTDGDPITSMAVATDDAEPGIIIAATDAPVASMTPESQFGWTGTLYIPVGTEIEGAIAGGDADAECLVIVTATYRAVVSGGNLT